MRRADREVTDRQEILAILNQCTVGHLALVDPYGEPYLVPMNFGWEDKEGTCTAPRKGASWISWPKIPGPALRRTATMSWKPPATPVPTALNMRASWAGAMCGWCRMWKKRSTA